MDYDKETINNLYALATSSKIESRLHHRYCPMKLFVKDDDEGGVDREVVLPIIVGTARQLKEAEVNAYKTTKAELGDVPFSDRGHRYDEQGKKIKSQWDKTYEYNLNAEILFACVRLPGQLDKQFFDSVEQVQAYYPVDVIGLIMDHYYTVRYTQPHYLMLDLELDTEDRFLDVIEKIKKQGTEADFFLNSLTTHSANQLIKFLVKNHTSSQNTNGGFGMHSKNTTETEQSQTTKKTEKSE
jgi:hypothetical protein